MRKLARTLGLLAITCCAVLVPAGSSAPPTRVVAAVELRPDGGSAARGAAHFSQRGTRLSGWVVVWGLAPGSRHAVHFHGPRGTCASSPAKPAVAAHADLVADARGVAYTRFALPSRYPVLRRGFYYNVHAGPATAGTTPSIACGEIRPLRVRG